MAKKQKTIPAMILSMITPSGVIMPPSFVAFAP
jgi:hypothetical protein